MNGRHQKNLPQLFYFSEQDDTCLTEIPKGVVSRMRFTFDRPLIVNAGQMIELKNGQWFLLTYPAGKSKRTQITGRWDR